MLKVKRTIPLNVKRWVILIPSSMLPNVDHIEISPDLPATRYGRPHDDLQPFTDESNLLSRLSREGAGNVVTRASQSDSLAVSRLPLSLLAVSR